MVNPFHNEAVGKLVLRLSLGVLVLFHGVAKVNNAGALSWIGGRLAEFGLPTMLAYGVYVGEIVAPLMIILGLWCRAGAALIVVNMVFALALAHSHELFELSDRGFWTLELQGMYLFAALALLFLGGGRLALLRD